MNCIKPFEDNYSKKQMKEWKRSNSVKKVHKDLYIWVNEDDPSFDTYIAVIIRTIFLDKNEHSIMWSEHN